MAWCKTIVTHIFDKFRFFQLIVSFYHLHILTNYYSNLITISGDI